MLARVKVSHGGGGNPSTPPIPPLPANPFIHLDADSLALGDMDPVALWPDLSGNGNTFAAAPGNEPLCVHNAINGLQAVAFGAAPFMTCASVMSWAAATGLTVCAVLAPTASGTTNILTLNGGSPWTLLYGAAADALGVFTGAVNNSDAVFPSLAWALVNFQHPLALDPGQWFQGVTDITVDPQNIGGVADPTAVNVLGAYAGGASPFDGFIAELVVYQREFSPAERLAWADYVAAKYGL